MLTILPSHVYEFRSTDGNTTGYSFTFPRTVFISRSSGGHATGYSYTYSSNHALYLSSMKDATYGKADISSYTFPYNVWVTWSTNGHATGYSYTYSSNHTAGMHAHVPVKLHKEEALQLKEAIKKYLNIE